MSRCPGVTWEQVLLSILWDHSFIQSLLFFWSIITQLPTRFQTCPLFLLLPISPLNDSKALPLQSHQADENAAYINQHKVLQLHLSSANSDQNPRGLLECAVITTAQWRQCGSPHLFYTLLWQQGCHLFLSISLAGLPNAKRWKMTCLLSDS